MNTTRQENAAPQTRCGAAANETPVLPSQLDSRAIERKIFGLDEEIRLGKIGAREHHDGALVQIVAILLAKLVNIASVKRTVRATRNASGLIAVGSQAVATLTVTGKTDDSTSKLVVEATSDQASNVSLSATQKIVGTFKVYDVPEGSTYGPYTLTFNVGTEYNGATATVFIEHQGRDANLGTETKTATVSNGNVTISTDGLSLVTIAVDSSTVTGATTDASATSPQTGVDMTGIAVATVACAIAAVGVGVVLRKKLAE